jgi:hypothetical protein
MRRLRPRQRPRLRCVWFPHDMEDAMLTTLIVLLFIEIALGFAAARFDV